MIKAKTVTVMVGTSQKPEFLPYIRAATRTHRDTTGGHLLFIDNEIHTAAHEANSNVIREELRLLGYDYHRYEECFNLNLLYNLGASMTESDYIIYTISDSLFFPQWWTELRAALDSSRCYSAHPRSFEAVHGGLQYFREFQAPSAIRETALIETQDPPCYVTAMKREKGHVWDEDFPGWEQDCDYWETLKKMGVQSVINPRSRVDHLWAPISGHMDMVHEATVSRADSTSNLRKKWNK